MKWRSCEVDKLWGRYVMEWMTRGVDKLWNG